jgi:hypothetical protein
MNTRISILWDIAPRSQYVNRLFCLTTCCTLVFSFADFRPWRWRWYVPPKRRFIYALHGAISQNITLLTTAVRISSPRYWRHEQFLIQNSSAKDEMVSFPCYAKVNEKSQSAVHITTVERIHCWLHAFRYSRNFMEPCDEVEANNLILSSLQNGVTSREADRIPGAESYIVTTWRKTPVWNN